MPIHKFLFLNILLHEDTGQPDCPPENPDFFPTSSRQLSPQQPTLRQPGPHSKHTNSSRVEIAIPSNPSYKKQDMDKWKIFPKAITKIEPHDIILGQNKTTSQYDRGNAWYHILNLLQHQRLKTMLWVRKRLSSCWLPPTKHPSPTLKCWSLPPEMSISTLQSI